MRQAESEQQRSFQQRLARLAAQPGPGRGAARPGRRDGAWRRLRPGLCALALLCGALGSGLVLLLRGHLAFWPAAPGPDLALRLLGGLGLATLIGPGLSPFWRMAGLGLGLLFFPDLVQILCRWAGHSL